LVGYLDVLNRKDAARITGDFLGWLSRQQQQPFFAFLNYYDAHQPYLPPESFELKFGPEKPRGNLSYFTNSAELDKPWQMSPQQVQGELDAYDSAISYMDHHLGLLFDELAHQGILENTLIIVTSDHGEQFGEHSLFGHTNSLYIQTLHVPLVISFPGRVPVGVRIPEVASLRDLPTTVLDLIGFKGETRFPGTSLAQHWQEPHSRTSPISESVLSEINHRAHFLQSWYPLTKGDMKSLVTNRYHYIKNGDDREELYDLENDASEEHDLSSSEEGRQAIVQFRTSLEAILAQSSSSTIS
jgi:arylsulfatase A-like enzyme